MAARVLLVDDEPNQLITISRILTRHGCEVVTAGNGEEALAALDASPVDVMVTDLNMPIMDGMTLLRSMESIEDRPATIVLTGYGTIPSAVEAMKTGAADYLIKPCNPDELKVVVDRQLELRSLRREVRALRREVARARRFGALIGDSEPMQEVYRVLEAVSGNKSTVLITGESGTGKELVARTLHERAPWSQGPFIAINCGAVSETLLDSQLFGHRKGAFTGASGDQEGVFQAAAGGTLFLDEVSEIPLPLQVKFLRAIQEREITPLGAVRPIKTDARIVAATNRDLRRDVADGRFREDLFYRLNVVNLGLPPLRERPADLDMLIDHFLEALADDYQVAPRRISDETRQVLREHHWPGNVRELQNALERGFALSSGDEIAARDVRPALEGSDSSRPTTPPTEADVVSLEEAERRAIRAALAQAEGNKNEAARLLRIDRQRLYRKMDKYDLRA